MTSMTALSFAPFLERDGYRCIRCGRGGDTLVPNHRANRGHGGSKLAERPSNVVVMCSDCNGMIESDAMAAQQARDNGWKLQRHEDPETEPAWDPYMRAWYLLDDDHGRKFLGFPEAETRTGARIAQILQSAALTYSNEDELQVGIYAALTEANLTCAREVQLVGRLGRIDLLVYPNIGVEVKVAGSVIDVTRQLMRYAHATELRELVLVTTKAAHLKVPREVAGVPVQIICLIGGGLL